MSPAPLYRTTCKICHRIVTESPPLNVPPVGTISRQAVQLRDILARHLQKHHPGEFEYGAGLSAEFQALILFLAFDCQDPSVVARLEMIRAAVFAWVRKPPISDPVLEQSALNLNLNPADTPKVAAALKAVRDACTELGEFAPQIPKEAEKLIVGT